MKKKKIQLEIKHILKSQLYGVLATSCNNQPYTNLLAFVASEDLNYIYVATEKTTNKFEYLMKNEKVAFFIDTRSNSNFDVNKAMTLTIFGKAKLINKIEMKDIMKLYRTIHPQLATFINSQNVEFFQIAIESFSLVKQFKNVFILDRNEEYEDSN